MNISILLSGGIGSRLKSDIPKQYISVNGEMIVTRTLYTLLAHPMIDMVQIVAHDDWRDAIIEGIKSFLAQNAESTLLEKINGFSSPGENRQLSIYNAIMDIENKVAPDDVVLVQDAVRPFTTPNTITDCLTKIEGHDGALPVLPMKDTVYLSKDGIRISSLLNRNELFAGQAPEAYRYKKYREANEALLPDEILKINGACEPAIMAGMLVAMFPRDENNYKITTANDLVRYKEIIDKGDGAL